MMVCLKRHVIGGRKMATCNCKDWPGSKLGTLCPYCDEIIKEQIFDDYDEDDLFSLIEEEEDV